MEIAQVAAKYVAVDGINDFLTAKRKAAAQLGIYSDKYMPGNDEIEQALIDYQNLFQRHQQPARLKELRHQAIKAMRLLISFQPRLVGPVLSGTATDYTEITLHLFCDEPEQIIFFLQEHAIPFTDIEKNVKTAGNENRNFPGYRFIANEIAIVLIIFPTQQRIIPLSRIDNKPMKRATVNEVIALVETPC